MGLLTTTIGAFPKPKYVNLPDWFKNLDTSNPTKGWAEAKEGRCLDFYSTSNNESFCLMHFHRCIF